MPEMDGRTKLARALKAATARRREIAEGLLADLGRPVTMTDTVWAENVASLVFRADCLEAQGGDVTELRRLINQSMRAGGQKPAPPAPAKQSSNIQDLLAERGYKPPEPVTP